MAKNYREEIPILLVGNKVDLEKNRQVSKKQIEKFTQDNNIGSSTEISVKTGENVEEMFLKMSNMIINTGLIEIS